MKWSPPSILCRTALLKLKQKVSPICTRTCYFVNRRKSDSFDMKHSWKTHVWVLLVSAKHLQTAYLSHFSSENLTGLYLMKFSCWFSKLPSTSLEETAKRPKSHIWKFSQTESKRLATFKTAFISFKNPSLNSLDFMIWKKNPTNLIKCSHLFYFSTNSYSSVSYNTCISHLITKTFQMKEKVLNGSFFLLSPTFLTQKIPVNKEQVVLGELKPRASWA